MKSWLYPISKRAKATFNLKSRPVPVSLATYERLVRDGRLVQDEWWHIATNFLNVQRGDEIFIYTGDEDRGIVGYATVRAVGRAKRRIRLKFDLKRCLALLEARSLPASVVRDWISFPRAAVLGLSPFLNGLRQHLPWTTGRLVNHTFRRALRGSVRKHAEPGRGDLFQELESAESTLKDLSTTEREAVRLSRIGQGRLRESLLALWGRCAVTGCEETQVLRASHLKPWAKSTNRERLDPHNGLLLSPNLDAALDAGLVTFDDEGRILLSSQLSSQDATSLGIDPKMKMSLVDKRHLKYLRYHRQEIFKH
jgi:hypothetical protein